MPSDPDFGLLSSQQLYDTRRPRAAAIGSVIAHLLFAALVAVIPWGPGAQREAPIIEARMRPRVTPLYMPPIAEMTQKAPNTKKPSESYDLQGLLQSPKAPQVPKSTPGRTAPAAAEPSPTPPAPRTPDPKPAAPVIAEAPRLDTGGDAGSRIQNLPPGMTNPVPQPRIEPQEPPQEKPKIAFERVGAGFGSSSGAGRGAGIPMPPRSSVEEAAREVARNPNGGVVVGDLGSGSGGLGDSLTNPAAAVTNKSALELLSDPMGADFKPYLIRILSTVRRNWMAVMPESARMGRRGKVLIQFAINRNGSVPKLVIAATSGAEPLDRAAVASISASNPFPPLPDEFRGQQVRLQFTFAYNAPK